MRYYAFAYRPFYLERQTHAFRPRNERTNKILCECTLTVWLAGAAYGVKFTSIQLCYTYYYYTVTKYITTCYTLTDSTTFNHKESRPSSNEFTQKHTSRVQCMICRCKTAGKTLTAGVIQVFWTPRSYFFYD